MFAQKLNFCDVLIKPKKTKLSSRSQVNLNRSFNFKNSKSLWRGVPIVSSNMDTIGTSKMYKPLKEKGMINVFNKHIKQYPKDLTINSFMYSSGLDTKKLYEDINNFKPKFVCFDIANGYIQKYHDVIREFKDKFPEITVCAGNVVTPEMVEYYITECGVDIVKIGIGSGSVCTTRNKTGVGYPQLSCILDCAKAAHSNGGYIMSDGGIKQPGDVAKAFAAGADFVMLGGILSGHDENINGQIFVKNGKKYVKFYGMSSQRANELYSGGTQEYRAAEGREIEVELKGPVENTLNDILGGVRSACTYLNCENLEELPENAEFIIGN